MHVLLTQKASLNKHHKSGNMKITSHWYHTAQFFKLQQDILTYQKTGN